jgi:glycosyltransferase involved in cell wall biosynthesis
MRLVMCHNYYQRWGGEDQVFEDEAALLQEHGHDVIRFTKHNDSIGDGGKLGLAIKTVWNNASYHELRNLLRKTQPDLIHFTNSFPLISPAAYHAARAERVPILHALHDYRLLCPQGHFLRDGKLCEDCLTKRLKWPSVQHSCYRQSRAGSAVVSSMIGAHHALRTWDRIIDRYYTVSQFARRKFIEGGFPAEKIRVKPNFVHPDPGIGAGSGGYAVFAARLSPEKGLQTLLDAWSKLPFPYPLKIAGDGPLAGEAREFAARNPHVQWLGLVPLKSLLETIGEASFLVIPSTWYETFGRTIIEAFAKGTPVISTRLGAMTELIDEGRNGLYFERADSQGLADRVQEILADPARLAAMRLEARRTYERSYTPAANYQLLLDLFEDVLGTPVPADDRASSLEPTPRLSAVH